MKFSIARRGAILVIALLTLMLAPGCGGVGGGGKGPTGDALFKDWVHNIVIDNWGDQARVAANNSDPHGLMGYYHNDYLDDCQTKQDLVDLFHELYVDPYTYDFRNVTCENIQLNGSQATADVTYDRVRIDSVGTEQVTHFAETWHFIKDPPNAPGNQYNVLIYGNQQCGP